MENTSYLDGKPILVHKKGQEGALAIGSLSGRIVTPIMERPDWSEGLAVADLAERHDFYTSRLGRDMPMGDLVAFEDLGWVAIDGSGEQTVIEADTEHRMDIIAEATGVHRTADLSSELQDDTTGEMAHVVLDETREYQHNEAKAVDTSWEEKLGDAATASGKAVSQR